MTPIEFSEIIKTMCTTARKRGAEIMYMDKEDDGSILLVPLDAAYEKFTQDNKKT